MSFRKFRSSNAFVTLVVCVAIYTDLLLSNLIVPILPYALSERVGLPQEDIQKWNSILLALYGASQMVGSCVSKFPIHETSELYLCPLSCAFYRFRLTACRYK